MSDYYEEDYYGFQERFPGIYALILGATIGALAAIAISSVIVILQFCEGLPWKELLIEWGQLLLLTIPAMGASGGAVALIYHYRRVVTSGVQTEQPYLAPPQEAAAIIGDSPTLSEAIVQNAKDQAIWHYEWGREPARRAMEERGVPQTIWNSARHLLTVAQIVEGNTWAAVSLEDVERVLDRLHPDGDHIWVGVLGARHLISVSVAEKARNKRYTVDPPTLEPQGPEY